MSKKLFRRASHFKYDDQKVSKILKKNQGEGWGKLDAPHSNTVVKNLK